MKEFIITWCIENITYSWHKTGEKIISPKFVASPIQNSSWVLHLYPRGESLGDYLSLYLQRGEDEGPSDLAIYFEFSFITAAGNPYAIKKFFWHFLKGEALGHQRVMGRHDVFFERKDLYLPQDILTLRCRIWTGKGTQKECGRSFGRTRLDIERISSRVNIGPEKHIGPRRFSNGELIRIRSKLQNEEFMIIQSFYLEQNVLIKIIPCKVDLLEFSTCKLSLVDKRDKSVLNKRVGVWLGPPRQEIWRMPFQKEGDTSEDVDSTASNIELVSEFVYSTGQEAKMLEKDFPYSPRLSELVSKYINSCSENLSDCPKISQDLWNLYTERVLCDLELKTKTSSFFVHKFVLCARSPVFLAMLSHDMKDKINKCIEIEDIVDDVLKTFLFFLYTDTFEDLEWERVIGLYYAADKYYVERLKIMCSSFLLKNIDVDNVCELLLLADKHHDIYFKRRVEDFILQNDERIFSSSIWKQFACEHSLLSAATMLLIYDKQIEIYFYAQRQPNLTILSCSSQRNLSTSSMTPNDVSFIPERNKSSSKIMDRNQQFRIRGIRVNPIPIHESDSADSSRIRFRGFVPFSGFVLFARNLLEISGIGI
ncbi:Protein roadkill [Araneus ventricosus]|uniref:Protein roadkill n=1 Tax=Araneus ventricosus TaxID=182803 RepID=A0A4Y2RP11_ARAVE|nr:Protein roadkill [Araneus ventricosus]